jgi:hypothetical protein
MIRLVVEVTRPTKVDDVEGEREKGLVCVVLTGNMRWTPIPIGAWVEVSSYILLYRCLIRLWCNSNEVTGQQRLLPQ